MLKSCCLMLRIRTVEVEENVKVIIDWMREGEEVVGDTVEFWIGSGDW